MKIKNRKAKMAVPNGNGASEMNTIAKTDVLYIVLIIFQCSTEWHQLFISIYLSIFSGKFMLVSE